jgi:hypothetical protein
VLAAIVDGPVDADKADYIVRDSARCELPYGSQVDMERLLRVLTVAILPGETAPRRVTLGVYDKGLTSAHALSQARYQLLSTVYWHHTVRILKAMLQYATAIGLPRVVFGAETAERDQRELQIRERLVSLIKSMVPPFAIPKAPIRGTARPGANFDLGAHPPEEVLTAVGEEKVEGNSQEAAWYPGITWTDWLMLEWIKELPSANAESINLVRSIQTRRLYKRIATFARGQDHDNLLRALDELAWPDRVDIASRLSKRVVERLKRDWGNLNTASLMSKSEFDELCDVNLIILVDVPNPSKKIGYDKPLGVVPELREKSYHQDSRQAFEDRGWREIMAKMVEGIAPVRVLCHPDVRNLVSAVYAPTEASFSRELTTLLQ